MSEDECNLYRFPVERIKDNRAQGLLRELAEMIESAEDASALRYLGQSLKLLAGRARSRAFSISDDDLKLW